MTTGDALSVREWRDLARSRGRDLAEIAGAVGSYDKLGDFSPNVAGILCQVGKMTRTLINIIEILGLPRDAKLPDLVGAVRTLKENAGDFKDRGEKP